MNNYFKLFLELNPYLSEEEATRIYQMSGIKTSAELSPDEIIKAAAKDYQVNKISIDHKPLLSKINSASSKSYIYELMGDMNKRYGCIQAACKCYILSLKSSKEFYPLIKLGELQLTLEKPRDAIKTFEDALSLQRDWRALCGKGSALIALGEYNLSIKLIHEAIDLNRTIGDTAEIHETLAKAYYGLSEWEKCIQYAERSYRIKKKVSVLQILAIAHSASENHKLAVTLFDHITIFEPPLDHVCLTSLSQSLFHLGNYKRAHAVISKALKIKRSPELCTFQEKCKEHIEKTESIYSPYVSPYVHGGVFSPIIEFDPYLGFEHSSEHIEGVVLQSSINHCNKYGYDFIPSYWHQNNPQLKTKWGDICFIHIPKCAGTSFQMPIIKLLRLLGMMTKEMGLSCTHKFYGHSDIHDFPTCQAILDIITSEENHAESLGSFFSFHGSEWKNFINTFESLVSREVKIICSVREPQERLLSNIKHAAAHCNSVRELEKHILNPLSEWSFNNSIHRYIFNDGLSWPIDKDPLTNHLRIPISDSEILFLDYKDQESLSRIKSMFISSNNLPNMVHAKRINSASNRSKRAHGGNLNSEDIASFYLDLVSRGYLALDNHIDIQSLQKYNLAEEKSNFDSRQYLHPLTFVLSDSKSKAFVMKTREFLNNTDSIIASIA